MTPIARVLIAALVLSAPTASAGSLAELHLVSRASGQRLPVYHHEGRSYVAGQPGERYSLQLINRSGGRILAVVSVDGINVVSGESAAPAQTGYVLAPWQSYDVAGWRTSASEVAAFHFTALSDSYAARTGRPIDVGVIGLAVFREWTPPGSSPQPNPQPLAGAGESRHDGVDAKRAQAPPAESANDSSARSRNESERAAPAAPWRPRDQLGTGHGEREHAPVSFTEFRRTGARPQELISLYYDRYENLVARGIVTVNQRIARPRPFPASPRFVPDPPD